MTFFQRRVISYNCVLAALLTIGCLNLKEQKIDPALANDSGPGSGGGNSTPAPPVVNPILHPDPVAPPVEIQKADLQRKGAMVGKKYVSKVLNEVLADATYTGFSLYPVTDLWVTYKGNSFGEACNVYSSFAGKDCSAQGSTGTTGFSSGVVGAQFPMVSEGSTLRQLNKMQLCDILFSSDNALRAAANKIGAVNIASSATPSSRTLLPVTDTIIQNLFKLFYRGRAMTSAELNIYNQLNSTLLLQGTESSTRMTRYRLILIMMCESPDWEIL